MKLKSVILESWNSCFSLFSRFVSLPHPLHLNVRATRMTNLLEQNDIRIPVVRYPVFTDKFQVENQEYTLATKHLF